MWTVTLVLIAATTLMACALLSLLRLPLDLITCAAMLVAWAAA